MRLMSGACHPPQAGAAQRGGGGAAGGAGRGGNGEGRGARHGGGVPGRDTPRHAGENPHWILRALLKSVLHFKGPVGTPIEF
jgi:hypothetical protein